MADLVQLPAELNLKVSIADDFSFILDFDIDLTGYTFTASMIKSGGIVTASFTVTEISLSEGKISLSITKEDLATIGTGKNHTWWLKWVQPTNIDRKILAGKVELVG